MKTCITTGCCWNENSIFRAGESWVDSLFSSVERAAALFSENDNYQIIRSQVPPNQVTLAGRFAVILTMNKKLSVGVTRLGVKAVEHNN